MDNYGSGVKPTMMGVAETGGDNANMKPDDPSGPQARSLMSESEQHSALSSGARAANLFPKTPDKVPDNTYGE